jgi:SAM-dependent methyltransferase
MTAADIQSTLSFTCNICGTRMEEFPFAQLDRELVSCTNCGSTVRWRSIIHLLSLGLFGESIQLGDFPVNKSIIGIGLSDQPVYAELLERKFSYTNTFIHQEPLLDIVAPSADLIASQDFVISSDVFEHVMPPVARAFEGAFELLKPGGHFVLTVPFVDMKETIEHFPDVKDYQIVRFDDQYVMVLRDHGGRLSLRTDLVFHGGDGDTLEMRLFARGDLQRQLEDCGFENIVIFDQSYLRWGLVNQCPWSFPVLARKPS